MACEEVIDDIAKLHRPVATRNGQLADNLRRSSLSALFNTSEGLAAWNPKEKLYRYELGRREMNEVRAGLRVAVRQKIITWAEPDVPTI